MHWYKLNTLCKPYQFRSSIVCALIRATHLNDASNQYNKRNKEGGIRKLTQYSQRVAGNFPRTARNFPSYPVVCMSYTIETVSKQKKEKKSFYYVLFRHIGSRSCRYLQLCSLTQTDHLWVIRYLVEVSDNWVSGFVLLYRVVIQQVYYIPLLCKKVL